MAEGGMRPREALERALGNLDARVDQMRPDGNANVILCPSCACRIRFDGLPVRGD